MSLAARIVWTKISAVFLREISIYANEEIVERFKGGFVHAFHTETICVAESLTYLLWRKLRSKDVEKVIFKFSDLAEGPPPLVTVYDIRWPFDFFRYCTLSDDSQKKRQIGET